MMIKLLLSVTLLLALSSARITIPISKRHISGPEFHLDIDHSFLMADDEGNASKSSQNLHQTLKNSKNLVYYGEIYAGEQNTPFQVIFDTSSDRVWLPTRDCTTCPGTTKYDCGQSSTCSIGDLADELTYDFGHVEGIFGSEMIGFSPDMKANTAVLWASSSRDFASDYKMDGVVGFGSQNGYDLIDLAYNSRHIKDKVFSFHLDHNSDINNESNGSYLAIGYTPEKYANKLKWIEGSSPFYWKAKVLGMQVGNEKIDITKEKAAQGAIFDSSTSYVWLASSVIAEMKSQMVNIDTITRHGSVFYRCDAGYLENYPNVTLVVKNMDIVINVYSYLYFNSPVQRFGKNYCASMIRETTKEHQRLGDAFLKNNVVVFSKINQTMGIYQEYRPIVLPSAFNPIYIFVLVGFLICLVGFILWKRVQNKKLQKTLESEPNSTVSQYYAPDEFQKMNDL